MASYYRYKCKECDYSIDANPEGHDTLMMGEVYNFHCPKCRKIVDVLLHPFGGFGNSIICPNCGCKELTSWNPITGKCPKCNGEMGNTRIHILAD